MNALQGWRSLLIALLVAVLGVLQAVDWATIVPQGRTWTGVAMIVIGAVMALMRYFSTTPVGMKSPRPSQKK